MAAALPTRRSRKLVSLLKGTTRAVVALKPTKALRQRLHVSDEKRLLARAACETLIELVRESGDVFPPLKATAGGLAMVLKQLRVSTTSILDPQLHLMTISDCR